MSVLARSLVRVDCIMNVYSGSESRAGSVWHTLALVLVSTCGALSFHDPQTAEARCLSMLASVPRHRLQHDAT